MQEEKHLSIFYRRKKYLLNINEILYILMVNNSAEIHMSDGRVFVSRMTMGGLEIELGENFLKVNRGCLVSVMAIHDITDSINLSNGEKLIYTIRKRKEILEQFRMKQKRIINDFCNEGVPITHEEYHKHYRSFDNLPFAFTDIEMVFNEENRAVDWIFRYGNNALADLEKISLDRLLGHSFGSIFSNMDAKWLKCYERATLYGETLEMLDYSPEIDSYLKVICFPTFKGHCGCILFHISDIKFTKSSDDTEKALMLYLLHK